MLFFWPPSPQGGGQKYELSSGFCEKNEEKRKNEGRLGEKGMGKGGREKGEGEEGREKGQKGRKKGARGEGKGGRRKNRNFFFFFKYESHN